MTRDARGVAREPGLVIRLSAEAASAIRAHAASAYPEECCGALLGAARDGIKEIRTALALPNARRTDRVRRYEIGAEPMRNAERLAREHGIEVVGIYHSHPGHPARPSEHDRERAWPWYSYVIVSVEGGRPVELRSWVLADDRSRFEEEEVSWP